MKDTFVSVSAGPCSKMILQNSGDGRLGNGIGRILIGSAYGCFVLWIVYLIVIHPFYPLLLKADERWNTIIFFGKVILPVALGLGALAGMLWRRSRRVRLTPLRVIVSGLTVALVAGRLNVRLALIHLDGTPVQVAPFETVPDSIARTFALLALGGVVWAFVRYIARRQATNPPERTGPCSK